MEDLKALSARILEKTKEEGQNKLDEYEKVANDRMEETRQKLVESKKNRKAAIAAKIENDYEREVQTLANKQRNAILSEKQALLHSVFDDAAKKMEEWDADQFAVFLQGVLSQLDANDLWQVVPGGKSVHLFDADPVANVLDNYSFVTLSKEVVNNKSGFVVEQGGIDYNFCFDELVAELKKEFSPQLATLAFKK
ncbi:V/A-type H+-transporting ATPase subunit E [Natronobacillus azotifigens]|uniref:V-type ATP synthase subunit E n=1 Tax=Natronobacillus azotifigens TaxID=472978 RepID=A0A9J6R9P1_9BACI|nr:hypothetical protein [Natronobacillus azotifigens]MCZ0701977.1 hypothetical protein [Natronobacillus azotifigens]